MNFIKKKYLLVRFLSFWITLFTLCVSCSDSDDEKAEGKYQFDDVWVNIYTSQYYYETDSTGKTNYTFFFSPEICTSDDVHITSEGVSDGVNGIYLSIPTSSFGQDLTAESNPAIWTFIYTETWNQTVVEGTVYVAQNEEKSDMFDITFELIFDNEKRIKGDFHGTCAYCESKFFTFNH